MHSILSYKCSIGSIITLVIGGFAVTYYQYQPWNYIIWGLAFVWLISSLIYNHRKNKESTTKQIVEKLKSLSIFLDSSPGDVINVLYHLKDKLSVGLSDREASNQTLIVMLHLSRFNIVNLEQRRILSTLGPHDEGYWIFTNFGKKVIDYLQANHQIFN